MNEEIQRFLAYLFQDFFKNVSDPANLFHKVILSIIIIFIWLALLKASKFALQSVVKNLKFYTTLYLLVKNIVHFIGILLLLAVWMNVKNSALLMVIVIVLVSAFSVKNLSTNLVAWLMLLRKRYFTLYDRIELQGIKGDVIKITPFYFKMIERGNHLSSNTATGRVIQMPNHILLDNPVQNYNELLPINWEEVRYSITVDSDWKKALEVIKAITNEYVESFLQKYEQKEIQEMERQATFLDEELVAKTYTLYEEGLITIIAQFPIDYRKAVSTKSFLHKQILDEFDKLPQIQLSGKALQINVKNQENEKSSSGN